MKYFLFVSAVIVLLTPIIKIVLPFMISQDYFESWLYIPITLIGVGFSALASFYGAGYVASKKTAGAFYTTMTSSILGIVFTLTFIKTLGLYAVALSSIITYLSMWIIRHVSMKKIFIIKVKIKGVIISAISLTITLYLYYYENSLLNIIWFGIVMIFYLLLFKKDIFSLILYFKNEFKKRGKI